MNTYLNSTYYNSLNATAQSQTTAKDWSIGVVTYDNNDLADQINDENGTKWNGKVALVTTSEYIRSNSDKSNCGSINLNNNNNNVKKQHGWIKQAYIIGGCCHLTLLVLPELLWYIQVVTLATLTQTMQAIRTLGSVQLYI